MSISLKPLLAASLVMLLTACASSHVLTGRARAPIDPAQVRVYFSPPAVRYEEIARLETSSGALTYGEQNKMDSVIGKLRIEAAKLGANGVLVEGTENGYGGGGVSIGGGGGRIGGRGFSSAGVGVDVSPRQKYARGIAVYFDTPPPTQSIPPPR